MVTNRLLNVVAIPIKSCVNLNARRYLNVDTNVRIYVVLHVPRNVKFCARKLSHVDTKNVCPVTEIPMFINATAAVPNAWNVVILVQRNATKLVNATLKLKGNYLASTGQGSCVERKTVK